MQSRHTSKIESIALYIRETGESPEVGAEITWYRPGAYKADETIQMREPVTVDEIKEAEEMLR